VLLCRRGQAGRKDWRKYCSSLLQQVLTICSQTVLLCCKPYTCSTEEANGYSVPDLQVQSGGSFDIDFEVKDPRDVVVLDGTRERQGDYILTANHVGEYSFCFINDMSTLTEKLVDFDIMVRLSS
jgi:hypothetical protein